MESQRPDPGLGVQLQLEEALGHRRTVLVELLLSPLPRCDQDRAGNRFFETPPTSRQRQAAHRMGRRCHPPQSTRSPVPGEFARQNLGGTTSGVCPRTQSRRIPLGLLETARITQPVCTRSLATFRMGRPCATSYSPKTFSPHLRLLAPSGTLVNAEKGR